MSQETPHRSETASRFPGRSAGATSGLWCELEIKHPGNPKAQLQTWIDQTAEHIRAGDHAPDTMDAETSAQERGEEIQMTYREAMAGLCRRAGLSQPDTAAELLILTSEGAKAARKFEGPDAPSDRFRRVAEATVARLSRRDARQMTFAHCLAAAG